MKQDVWRNRHRGTPEPQQLATGSDVRHVLGCRSVTPATLAHELGKPVESVLFSLRELVTSGDVVTEPAGIFLTPEVFVHATKRQRTHLQGFTLIELLVVIAIIGLLAALLLPSYRESQKKPYDLAALQCGKAVVTAETVYKIQNGAFQPDYTQLGSDVTEACTNVSLGTHAVDVTGPNMSPGSSSTAGWTLAFTVWSPNGSGFYRYWNNGTDTDKLNHLFKW